jgi:antitoxin component YwqK of YwqJK toxin-antitoxin module
MRKKLFILGIVAVGLLCVSANLHLQTSADEGLYLHLKLGNVLHTIHLESPGIKIDKYPSGQLKHLSIPRLNGLWEIFFHKPMYDDMKEQISLIKRFRLVGEMYTLEGPVEQYNEDGDVISVTTWNEGVMHGPQMRYDDYGLVLEERYYDQGFPIGAWKMYYTSGNIATEIAFPKSKSEWDETYVPPARGYTSDSIFAMPYYHPKMTQEIWYDEDGVKFKEIEREYYRDGNRFVIAKTGTTRSYNEDGKVVQKRKYNKLTGEETRAFVFDQFNMKVERYDTLYDMHRFNVYDQIFFNSAKR